MSIFDDIAASEAEAEARIQNYSPSVQETLEETPEVVDKTPITAEENAALDKAMAPTFQSPFGDGDNQHAPVGQPRVTSLLPDGEWVSPVVRDREKLKRLLPRFNEINELDARITAVMRFDGAPKSVSDLAQKARLAVAQTREIRNDASHPDNPRYTRSIEAKDAVVAALANAKTMVGALEREAQNSKDEWFDNLTADLDKKREAALKAVKAAEKAYASLRGSVNAAQALAVESGKWDKDWHSSTTREADLNAPIAAMRAAVGFLESDDDFESGRFLTEEYEGIPPHTLGSLKRGAEVTQPGSFAFQLYARASAPMAHDKDLQDALRSKHLIPFLNSNPLTTDLVGRSMDED